MVGINPFLAKGSCIVPYGRTRSYRILWVDSGTDTNSNPSPGTRHAGLSQEIQNQMETAKMRTTLATEVQELEKVIQGQTGGLLLTEHRVGRRSEIMRIANEFGLALTFWKPEDLIQESPGQFVKVPVQVRVEGGYHQVAQFLESVLTRPWVLEVTTLTMARNSGIGETSTLWTSFRLIGVEAFSLHDFQRLAEHQDRQLLVPVGS